MTLIFEMAKNNQTVKDTSQKNTPATQVNKKDKIQHLHALKFESIFTFRKRERALLSSITNIPRSEQMKNNPDLEKTRLLYLKPIEQTTSN